MSFTIGNIDEHLIGMGHSGSLAKVRNKEAMYERAASIFSLKHKSIDQMRLAALASTVHDNFFNYALPSDFGSIVDLMPQDERRSWDKAYRNLAGEFDLKKAMATKTISLEGSEGTKFLRINWRSRPGKVLNTADDVDDNGTWSAINTASGIEQDTITRVTGRASLRFDVAASGDGVQNTTMEAVDLTDEDEVADVFVWVYFPSIANLVSVIAEWGNNLTSASWTAPAVTTQADGSAFKVGWNLLRFPWATAVETGTVAPATIDSFGLSFVTTGAIANIRMDNIVFSIGRAFDIKYYSKYLFKNSTTGTWMSKPTTDSADDLVMVDNDTMPLFLMELFTAMAHQLEGSDSAFDLNFALGQLKELYPIVRAATPNQTKRAVSRTTAGARFRRMGRQG